MSSGVQIVILLSLYFTGIKDHFDTNLFDTIFHSKDMRKTKLICLTFKNSKIYVLSS